MTITYKYDFSGSLAYVYGSGATFPQSVPIAGNFTVQYSDTGTTGNVQSYDIRVNGTKLNNASAYQTTNISGITTTRIMAYGIDGNSSGSNYLYLYYNGQQPSSFVNAEYSASEIDYSVYPEARTSATFRSQQVQVTSTVVCFVTNTHIATARGDIAVEYLKVGDLAVTASGSLRPITWIGRKEMTAAGAALPFNQQPVRVRAGAFGHGLPACDLSLSPGHPVLVGADADGEGGVLVPIMCLVNGTTITREPVSSVTYWHVELDAHDILLAEGLPAESYIDGGDRAFFSEASYHALHNPDFVPAGWSARCRPVAVDGPVVEAERQRLDAVFAGQLASHCAWDAHQNGI